MTARRLEPNLERMKQDILGLSQYVCAGEPGHTRISFSREDRQARDFIILRMKEANLSVRIDPVGNIIGRREGTKERRALVAGSHLDTVRGGGRFDGMSGVIAGLETVRKFDEEGIRTRHPLEVIVFIAEEPSPFGISTVGSRAMAGKLSAGDLRLKDETGRSLDAAVRDMGGDPERLDQVRRSGEEILCYLELHIEQGPSLFAEKIPIGVVTGIVGILRGKVDVIGRNDHAGTTPMDIRRDALAAGSEVILALERICREIKGVVGTTGRVEVFPNALNVVPGRVNLGMEARSLDRGDLDRVASILQGEITRIGETRGIETRAELWISSKPVLFDPAMVRRIGRVCDRLGLRHLELPSGAGHDANHLAEIAPAGMIFIPSKDGRSHCPEEWSDFEDVATGAEVLAETIYELDQEVTL